MPTKLQIDLENIKAKYSELYGRELQEAIDRECSGDYKKMLISLLNGEPVK